MTTQQIVNAPNTYISGFQVSNNAISPNTKVDVSYGQCRDSTNTIDIFMFNDSLTLDATKNGANGLDVGSLVANTTYSIYVIADARSFNAPALLLSTNADNIPIIPNGYGPLRIVGFISTDSSANFLGATWVGSSSHRTCTYNTAPAILSAGSQIVSTLIPIGAFVPSLQQATSIKVLVNLVPAAAGNTVSVGTTGQGSLICAGQVASVGNYIFGEILSKNRVINYINSAAACSTSIFLYGYNYDL
jgi:hypothetical protein